MKLRKQRDPESQEALASLVPQRRFTHDEVTTFINMARGLVSNGLPVLRVSSIDETPTYYHSVS